MRYQPLFKSLLGLCVLTVVVTTGCSDDFPTTNPSSDYLVTLEVTPEHAGVNEELTLTCTVMHEGEPMSELDLELRYTHLGADAGGGHGEKNLEDGPMGPGEDSEPAVQVAMRSGEEPGTYVGTHTFEESGNYLIELEFEGHEGPEIHQLGLAIE